MSEKVLSLICPVNAALVLGSKPYLTSTSACAPQLRRLLRWSPQSRLTAERALQHAYFREEGGGFECGTGVECEFRV